LETKAELAGKSINEMPKSEKKPLNALNRKTE
jgi:hypothetical protein